MITITASDVASWIGSTRPTDTTQLQACVDGATAWVNDNTDDTMAPDASRKLGTIILAARLYSRRGSTSGIQSFQEFGPAYVSKYDPDVTRMLGLDAVIIG